MTAAESKMLKMMCLADGLNFTRYTFKEMTRKKFLVKEHHKRINDALERVYRGECKRLIINMPPRYGKTELAVKSFIARGLALNPAAKFIHVSATKDLALDNSEGIREIVKSDCYQQLFPNVKIKSNTDSKGKWYTTAGGGVLAVGSTGQITGFGAGAVDDEQDYDAFTTYDGEGFGGAIVIDDPIKPDDADSDVKRVKANIKFTSTIESRVNSSDTPIIIIMQRLHPMDMCGYVMDLQPDKWEVLSLPALYQNELGEWCALWESKHTVEDLKEMESSDSEEVRLKFQRQMQQNPKSREGLMFALDALKFYDKSQTVNMVFDYKAGFVDPAGGGGDDTAFVIGLMHDGVVYVEDVVYNTHGTDTNQQLIIDKVKQYDIQDIEFEGIAGWAVFGTTIRAELIKGGWNGQLRIIKPYTNKHTRILAQKDRITNKFVFRSDWKTLSYDYRRYMLNLSEYRQVQDTNPNAHDDAPDATAGLSDFYKRKFPHLF